MLILGSFTNGDKNFHCGTRSPKYARLCHCTLLGSLSTHVFETRTATGSELFSLLSCLHTTEFALTSIFSPLEMLGIKIWETPLSWHAKCPLPVVVRVSKTCVLKLPIVLQKTAKNCTKIQNARAEPSFCSLNLFIGDVPVAVVVVFC